MNPYPTYPQPQGYGYVPYPPVALPPNQFYAAPQQANGYPAGYRPRYRRPSDPGPQTHEPKPLPPRRGKLYRQPEDEPRISRPTRPRKTSMRAGITPDFIFISLSSHDILKIANITSSSLSEYLLETMVPYWPESPVSHTDINGNLQLRLGGDVWGAKGNTAIMARRFICKLFMVLAQEGFGYLATVDNHPMKAPRLVFASVPPESHPHYFMISFSLSRRTVTIIDAPAKLSVLLGAALRQSDSERPNEAATTPRRSEDGWIHQGVYEVVTSHSTGRQDIALLMGGALKLIAAEGWRFEASVPFGKGGFLGLGGRREVWMFRREPTSPSRLPRPEGRKRKGI